MMDIFKNIWLKNNQKCILCGLANDNSICQPCFRDLPRLKSSCHICALPLPPTSTAKKLICNKCSIKKPSFDKVIALYNYSFPINRILPKLKHENQRHLFNWLADCFNNNISDHYQPTSLPNTLIPAPISTQKGIFKGYNQAEYLAKIIARKSEINIDENLIKKIKHTPAQATLSAKDRHVNLKNAFEATQNKYNHVAIIDDVLTTGSTANEMAYTLKKSGIQTVDVWVIARTPI